MRNIQFPLFKTKIAGVNQKFDLTDAGQRKQYFELKAGDEIKRLRDYLKDNTFIAYLLGKKNSGKGTYAKMLQEIVAPDRIMHLSIGDMIRSLDEIVRDDLKRKEWEKELSKVYRGFISLPEIIEALRSRSTQFLLPSELILAVVKMQIAKMKKMAIFIDGFPRTLDQVSYSLFFRDLVGYRDDPDVFVLIDVPESVIDERIKYRVVCPACQSSRNTKLLPTKKAGWDEEKSSFYLMCDNSTCAGEHRMVSKEGDELGIGPIKDRLQTDEDLVKQAFNLHGIPKVLLRNSVPIDKANEYVDDYEITPEYVYEKDANGIVKIKEKPWQINDDEGAPSYSLMPPPIIVSLIKQLVKVLNI
ncbi:MAG: nucleoside monophosphate kinase [Candidatus Pacebacteria bacterium]|nr:nucleoside monophosphate kinase [Candidatus Paceibacterota bacterium]